MWKNPEVVGRQHQCNILRGESGVRSEQAKAAQLMREAFDLFITLAVMKLLMDSTNARIDDTLKQLPERTLQDDTRPFLWRTDMDELYAVFGLMYFFEGCYP